MIQRRRFSSNCIIRNETSSDAAILIDRSATSQLVFSIIVIHENSEEFVLGVARMSRPSLLLALLDILEETARLKPPDK